MGSMKCCRNFEAKSITLKLKEIFLLHFVNLVAHLEYKMYLFFQSACQEINPAILIEYCMH